MAATPPPPTDHRDPFPPPRGSEDAARRLLLVEAFETADLDGRLVSWAERERAGLTAPARAGATPLGTLAARAEALTDLLASRVPGLHAVLEIPRLPAGSTLVVIVSAGLLGALGNALGPVRQVNILSLPLLGVLGWNLAVYAGLLAWTIAHALRGRGAREPGAGPDAPWGAAARALLRIAERTRRGRIRAEGAATVAVGRALTLYARAWRRVLGPLWLARVRRLLHLGAAALAAGLLAGMYLRGVAFEYQATWESTFLGPEELRALLGVILGGASAVLGQSLPDAAALAAIRTPEGGPAAPWIHLYAVTTGLVVLAPRLALAWLAARQARRLAAGPLVNLESPYFRRLLAAERGGTTRVDVVPYSYHLEPRHAEALTAAVREVVGHRARVRVRSPAEYGADGVELLESILRPDEAAPEPEQHWLVIVFTLAQGPEAEVHGELLSGLREWVVGEPTSRRLLVLVDGSGYRAQLAETGAEAVRLPERRRAWDRVVNQVGLSPAHVELTGRRDGAPVPVDLEPGLWPRVSLET